MIVTFQHTETKHRHFRNNLNLCVEFDNNLNIIKSADMYDDIDENLASKFCECFNLEKKLDVDSYKMNVDIMYQIYKETITKNGLIRVIKEFPRCKNGYFKRGRSVVIARNINAKYDKKDKLYKTNSLVAYAKTRSKLILQYKSVSFI